MANKKQMEVVPVKATSVEKVDGKPRGSIVYCPNLDSWRCLDASGHQVLSTGSKQAAKQAFPDFIVKE